MKEVRELSNNIVRLMNERVNNPIMSTFFISWLIFNWKPIMIFLFSGQTIEQRIRQISNEYSNLLHVLWLPLATTAVYLLIVPFLNWLFDIYSNRYLEHNISNISNRKVAELQGEINVKRKGIELEEVEKTYSTEKQFSEIRDSLNDRIKELESQNHAMKIDNEKTIGSLRKQLANHQAKYNSTVRDYEEKLAKLPDTNKYIGFHMDNYPGLNDDYTKRAMDTYINMSKPFSSAENTLRATKKIEDEKKQSEIDNKGNNKTNPL